MPWLVRCCVDVVAVGCVEVVVDPCSLQEGKNAIATMAPSKTNMYLLFEFMVTLAIEGRRVSSFIRTAGGQRGNRGFLGLSPATRRALTFQMIRTVLGFSVALQVAARQGNRLREIQESKNTPFAKNEPRA
jgi:hypothetical protein